MQDTTQQFRHTLRQFEREVGLQNNNCCNTGISLVQCHTIMDIEKNPDTSVKDIADRQKLDKSTISRTIDGLFNIGLVSREPNPESRRQTVISLTDNGKSVSDNINQMNESFFTEVFQDLSEKEIECFNSVFSKVTARMTEIRIKREQSNCC